MSLGGYLEQKLTLMTCIAIAAILHLKRWSCLYIRGTHLVIIVSADGLAPNATMPSTDTVLESKLELFCSNSGYKGPFYIFDQIT